MVSWFLSRRLTLPHRQELSLSVFQIFRTIRNYNSFTLFPNIFISNEQLVRPVFLASKAFSATCLQRTTCQTFSQHFHLQRTTCQTTFRSEEENFWAWCSALVRAHRAFTAQIDALLRSLVAVAAVFKPPRFVDVETQRGFVLDLVFNRLLFFPILLRSYQTAFDGTHGFPNNSTFIWSDMRRKKQNHLPF